MFCTTASAVALTGASSGASAGTAHGPWPNGGTFSLVVQMRTGAITTSVAPMSVSSRTVVEPPHATPAQWNTAIWVEQSAYPSVPSAGTTYIYGHACNFHICPFTNLKNSEIGDLLSVTTPSGVLSYRIDRIGTSSKSSTSLPTWASDSSVPNRIVLVTCLFDHYISYTNLVVIANLQSSHLAKTRPSPKDR